MAKKATQQGADEYEPTEDEKKAVTEARQEAQKERVDEAGGLAKRHREDRDAKLKEADMEAPDTSQEVEHEEEPIPEAEEKPPAAEEEVEDEFDTLTVDGQEQKVKKDKIYDAGKRTLQKEAAADKRLAEASDIKRQAEAEAARIIAEAKPLETGPSPSESPDVNKIAQAIVDGDVDEVAEVLKPLTVGRSESPTPISEDKIAAIVTDVTAMNEAMGLLDVDPDKGGFKDLNDNPTLKKMLLDEEAEIVAQDKAQGEYRRPTVRLEEAAKKVRQFRDELVGSAPKAEGFDDLQRKKQQAENTPTGAAGRASGTGASSDQPLTDKQKRDAAMKKIAAARHQDKD